MKKSLHFLFPTPIVKTKFPKPFTKEQLDLVYSTKIERSVGNKSSANRRILNEPGFEELKQFAQECLDMWMADIICPKDEGSAKLQLTQSWLNYTNPGGFHHAHYHPNSIVSGVIYIVADNETDQIQFQDSAPRVWHIENSKANEFNSNQYHVPVQTGDIVLFPSQMYHSVPELQGQFQRISLAFNSFYTGRVGYDRDSTNYLEIHSIK